MKRLLVLPVIAGLACLAPSRAAAQSIPVGPGSDLSSLVGLPIDVPFVADMSARPERLGSFALRIQWDITKLSLAWGANASFGSAQVNPDSLAFGIARIAGVNPAGAAGRVTLATARVTPLVSEATTLQVSLTELYAAGTFADLLPSAVVTSGAYCPSRGRWGDIDGDGNANSRDALIALSNAVGLDVTAFDIGLGDVDGNGITNARDALIILSNAVGVDVSAFRVLRLAGGACAANAGRALTIVPGGLDTLPLVVGQAVRFEARAGDAAGVLQAITDVNWRSDNPAVLGVLADGSGVAQAAGTAVVTMRRGATDSVQTTVHVVARRTTHWVDAQASGATNRLGSVVLPFGTLNEGVNFAQAGDTVRVRVGVYDLTQDGDGTLYVDRAMVVLGDTAADGSRPAIAGTWGNDGIVLGSPGSVEIHNFDVTSFSSAITVAGPSCALIRGVRASHVMYGVYVSTHAGCVRVERSRMIGPGQQGEGYSGSGVEAAAVVDTLTIEDTEISDFAYGVYDGAMQVDSLTIRRSLLHDAGYSAVFVSSYCYNGCTEGAPVASRPAGRAPRAGAPPLPQRGPQDGPPTSQAVVIEASRLARAGDVLVDLATALRRVVLTHSTFTNPWGGDVLTVASSGVGHLSMIGDSIVAPPDQQHYRWLDARYLDSLALDSVLAVGFTYSDVYHTPLVRVSHSTFRDVRSYGMQVSPSSNGGVVHFDNVGIYGDPRDDLSATGLEVSGVRAMIDGLNAVNLYEGVYATDGDSSTTITNSLFQHVEYPVEWYSFSGVAPDSSGLTVRNTTFRGFYSAIEGGDGTLVADSNTFVNGSEAIYADTPKPISVTRNRISGTEYGIDLANVDDSATVTVADNVISGTTSTALSVSGTYYQDLQTVLDVRGNTVTCTGAASASVTGILLMDAHIIALNNQVDGCYAGIWAEVATNSVRRGTLVGNTVTAPAGALAGIFASGNIEADVSHNTVTGARSGSSVFGLIDVVGGCNEYVCPIDGNVPVAIIGSNTVTGGTHWGIHAEYVDHLDVVGNTVRDLNTAADIPGYSEDFGGIALLGNLQTFARVLGNVVRHIAGNGIVIGHNSETTVSVDSNVVADIDSSGLIQQPFRYYGPVVITRNLFTGARREGLLIGGYVAASATDNNIAGNVYGLRLAPGSDLIMTATNNWWGDASGPSCIECPGTGDWVDGGVSWSPARLVPVPADSAPLLPPSPAARFTAQARSAAVAHALSATGPLDAKIQGGERLHAPKARPVRPVRPVTAARPGGASATSRFAERQAAEEQVRAAREAHAAMRLQQLRERAAARLRAEELIRARRTSSQRAPRSQGVRP